MGSKVPVFDDDIFNGMGLISMDELMTDEQEGFPEEEESFHFGYQERLTIDDSLMQTKTGELDTKKPGHEEASNITGTNDNCSQKNELKDEEYHEKRSKNRLAARKSRQNKRKLDEGRLNLLNSLLEEIEQLKLEIARIKVIEQKYIDIQTQYGLLAKASKPFTSMNIPEGGH
ncbi:unnamed protein product [Orchesella dallaii]|uniref:BZIP domain-containing protein n=1 Tax=Orchesella dallaii TaxID=48710 RepID=A0ABP1Q205_9HEXA